VNATLKGDALHQHMNAHHHASGSAAIDPDYHAFLHSKNGIDHTHSASTGEPEFDGKHVEPSYFLKYGVDIISGDKLLDSDCDHDDDAPQLQQMGPFAALMGGGHSSGTDHKVKYGTLLVMEVRTKDDEHFSIITVNEEGKQQSVYLQAMQLVRVVQ